MEYPIPNAQNCQYEHYWRRCSELPRRTSAEDALYAANRVRCAESSGEWVRTLRWCMNDEDSATLPVKGRDLRLDLFLGVANWGNIPDHIPNNIVNWVTPRNYCFATRQISSSFISRLPGSPLSLRGYARTGFRRRDEAP